MGVLYASLSSLKRTLCAKTDMARAGGILALFSILLNIIVVFTS